MALTSKNVVIGSGPSALGAVLGLLARGEKDILVVDQGNQLSSLGIQKKNEFSSIKNRQGFIWDLLMNSSKNKTKDIVEKCIWGDDFVYRGSNEFTGFKTRDMLGSFAFGGLSQVWGTAVHEYDQEDIHDWPFQYVELEKYYKKVRSCIPISEIGKDVPGNDHITSIFSDSDPAFMKNDFKIRNATVALDAKKCTFCGGCLTGCYRDALFSSAHNFTELIQRGQIKYVGNKTITSIEKVGDSYELKSSDIRILGKNIFVAAGCLHSTKLIADLLKSRDSFSFQDAAYLLIPAFSWTSEKKSDIQIPVVQKFLRFKNIHIQVYGYSQHIKAEIFNKLPRFFIFKELLSEVIARHFIIFQVFFDSRDSYKIDLSYKGKNLLLHNIEFHPNFKPLKQSLLTALRKSLFSKGVLLLTSFMKVAPVGRSFHYGGTLPMGSETDKWGQLPNYKGLFIVDGSVLPNIPSRTILLTLMANSMRIGREAPLNE